MPPQRKRSYYEFFAGGGMARLGLGDTWTCAFANDFDPVKAAVYRDNHGADHFREGDVFALTPDDLPGAPDLAWASSPCQDFSLAGARAGLAGGRSSAFFGFWRLIQGLADQGRAPRIVVIENVVGLLTSNGGADFTALCEALAGQGYRFGALEIDAARFVPQSRPRVFVVAVRGAAPASLIGESVFATRPVRQARDRLPTALRRRWIDWRLPAPPARNADLSAMLELEAPCRPAAQTAQLVGLMAPSHRARLNAGERIVGAVFRRTRGADQRAEVRTDGLAGCLRTPRGGSSRQMLVIADPDHDGGEVRSRLITPREGARLMGLPETYRLPARATAALHVIGDGVAVPVVRWLAERLLTPLAEALDAAGADAAA